MVSTQNVGGVKHLLLESYRSCKFIMAPSARLLCSRRFVGVMILRALEFCTAAYTAAADL